MNYTMPGFPVHHQLPELTQIRVCQVIDAVQPSHPLSSPFSFCIQSFPVSESFPMSQFFASGGQSIGVSAPPSVLSSVQFSSVAQSCPTLCDPMNRSTPGLPVHHQLLEFTQTHVHRVSDAISPTNEYSGLVGFPCSSRDSQESSPTPQFKSINSLVLSFLYSPTLT